MDIKVGEYVRTDKGNIGKVYEIRLGKSKEYEELYFNILKLDVGFWTESSYISNHSFDIIDLIEIGDFAVLEDKNLPPEYIWNIIVRENGTYTINNFENPKIISIVTKEQFDRERYIVGE